MTPVSYPKQVPATPQRSGGLRTRSRCSALLCALALAGCGGGSLTLSEATDTSAQAERQSGALSSARPNPGTAGAAATLAVGSGLPRRVADSIGIDVRRRVSISSSDTLQLSFTAGSNAQEEDREQASRSDTSSSAEESESSASDAQVQAQAEDMARPPQPMHGLPDLGNTSAINAILQLLVHDPVLGDAAAANQPTLDLAGFYAAYRSGNRRDIDSAVHTVVAELGRLHGHASGWKALLGQLWGGSRTGTSPGLGLPMEQMASPEELQAARNEDGEAMFCFAGYPDGDWFLEPVPARVTYRWLTARQQLHALVHEESGHYTVYLRQPHGWFHLDGPRVTQVTEEQIRALDIGPRRGLVAALYQRHPSVQSLAQAKEQALINGLRGHRARSWSFDQEPDAPAVP